MMKIGDATFINVCWVAIRLLTRSWADWAVVAQKRGTRSAAGGRRLSGLTAGSAGSVRQGERRCP